jgi:hypothetical protein
MLCVSNIPQTSDNNAQQNIGTVIQFNDKEKVKEREQL